MKKITVLLLTAFILFTTPSGFSAETHPLIRSEFHNGDIIRLYRRAIQVALGRIDAIVAIKPNDRTFKNTYLALELSQDELNTRLQPVGLMSDLHTSAAVRDEVTRAEQSLSAFYVELYTRGDLYKALKDVAPRTPKEELLAEDTINSFISSGINLPSEQRSELTRLKKRMSDIAMEFSNNIKDDSTQIVFTKKSLEGVPDSELSHMKKEGKEYYIVTMAYPDVLPILKYATSSNTRRKVYFAFNRRGGLKNTQILQEAIKIRQEIAKLLGEKSWAHYRISGRMAKNPETVRTFLDDLAVRLRPKSDEELAARLKLKQELSPGSTQLDPWDGSYLSRILQERQFSYDPEVVREYFPMDKVFEGVLEIYSELLGVRFEEVVNPQVWAPDVRMFRIFDKSTNKLLSFFYADLFPREGKYGHAAAANVIKGRQTSNGYRKPVSVIMTNFPPPSSERPSLLDYDTVQTFFHEFGHVMHGTLTQAKYAGYSGTSVARDFVEAPSQMLENWVDDPRILKRISKHYKTGEVLPDDLISKIQKSGTFEVATLKLRQVLLARLDLDIYSEGFSKDVNQYFSELSEEISGIKPMKGTRFPGSFGHIIDGYDAGYYGYLWSEVYAQAMFDRFEREGLMNPAVGADYRSLILENGGMVDALTLITEFLGKEPDGEAFYKKLGLSAPANVIDPDRKTTNDNPPKNPGLHCDVTLRDI